MVHGFQCENLDQTCNEVVFGGDIQYNNLEIIQTLKFT